MQDINALADRVRNIAYGVHVYLAQGHLEKVYENALANRLGKAGISCEQQVPIKVHDEDGTVIGDYFADLLVEGRLIVEIKAASTVLPEHYAQLLGYLRASRIEHGLLVNFGSTKFQIRKMVRSNPGPPEASTTF